MSSPIQPLPTNTFSSIEREMGFSQSLGVSRTGDSIATSSEEGGCCLQLFNSITNFFLLLFYCFFDQPETGSSETMSTQTTLTTTIETENIRDVDIEERATINLLAIMENLPRMQLVLLSMLERGEDPKAEEHLLILTKSLRKMIEGASANTSITIECQNDTPSTVITISQYGNYELFTTWMIEDALEVGLYWKIIYRNGEDEGLLTNELILKRTDFGSF